jgi:hypothetical protein
LFWNKKQFYRSLGLYSQLEKPFQLNMPSVPM